MTTTDTSNVAAKNAVGKLTKGTKPKRRMARPANAESKAQADPVVLGGAVRAPTLAKPDKAPRVTKSATVIALLQRERGATLAEMIEATGWLPHTTRAALTGLKKKGHVIVRDKRGDVTCYCIAPAAA